MRVKEDRKAAGKPIVRGYEDAIEVGVVMVDGAWGRCPASGCGCVPSHLIFRTDGGKWRVQVKRRSSQWHRELYQRLSIGLLIALGIQHIASPRKD